MTRRRWLLPTAAALLGLSLTACSEGRERTIPLPVAAGSEVADTTTTAAQAVTTTTEAATVTTTAAEPLPGLGDGDAGPAVLALEQRLDTLRYDVGTVDGVFDRITGHAVMAFQKVNGMDRTGRATDDVVAAVTAAKGVPPALVPAGGPTRVEVDVPRQFLMLYEGGQLAKILPVSTGSNQRFCSEGYCRRAVTPGGSFAVGRRARGWETGPLGSLYNPLYFNGGIAIHGAQSVPASPASHGCVRIPMNAAEWFPSRVPSGTPVYVIANAGEVPAPYVAPVTTTEPTPTVPVATTAATVAPTTTPTTVPSLLGGLLSPPTTKP